jgi:hypothetical protein
MIENNLHTDALELKYGPIQAVVMRHDPLDHDGERIREAKLVDGNGILRTYALTFLNNSLADKELLEIDEKIREGALIGQTFKRYYYEVSRIVLCELLVPLPIWMQDQFGVSQKIAHARLLEFYAKKEGSQTFLYGTLIEIYSPDFVEPKANFPIINNGALGNERLRSLQSKIIQHLGIDAA